jgi:hypothetical protein
MANVMGDLGGIVSGMGATLGKIVLLLIVMVGLYFGTKYIKKNINKKKMYKITAVITNPDGSHYTDKIGKFKDKDDMDKMKFLKMKLDTCPVINNKYIVNNSVHLFRYGPSEFAIIPPQVYRKVDINDYKITLINMNMLAFKGMEQRAAISRWATTKDKVQQWLPWITIVICVGCALGIIYFVTDFSGSQIDKVSAARHQECSEVFDIDTFTKTVVETLEDTNRINVVSTVTTTPDNSVPV